MRPKDARTSGFRRRKVKASSTQDSLKDSGLWGLRAWVS